MADHELAIGSVIPRVRPSMLDYRPNLAAKSLAERSSRVILLELPAAPYGAMTFRVMAELIAALAARGYAASVHLDTSTRHSLVATALQLRPRAVLVNQPLGADDRQRLVDAGIDTVVVPTEALRDLEMRGSQLRIGHLRDRGHRRIAIVERPIPELDGAIVGRRQSVLATARDAGMDEPAVLSLTELGVPAAAAVRRLREDGITAICAFNDDVGLAVLRAIADAGLRCPDDLAVIGADNTFAGGVAFPPLTTTAPDAERVAKIIAPATLAALGVEGGEESPAASDVAIELVVRGST
ncbi:substrate-binding domain-containing protein [Micromonospora sp. DT81.3]|uniref:substrate-binding domain-containing protein n=1 Tax=Micromonospora sp. DT81.3 TaxID=3416523 RepID=UPI003CE957C3